jgi:hypothetical protein
MNTAAHGCATKWAANIDGRAAMTMEIAAASASTTKRDAGDEKSSSAEATAKTHRSSSPLSSSLAELGTHEKEQRQNGASYYDDGRIIPFLKAQRHFEGLELFKYSYTN